MCASIHVTYLFAFLAPSTAPWNSLRWTSVIARRAKFDTLLYRSLAASYIPSSKHRSPIWKIEQENYHPLFRTGPTTPQIRFESDVLSPCNGPSPQSSISSYLNTLQWHRCFVSSHSANISTCQYWILSSSHLLQAFLVTCLHNHAQLCPVGTDITPSKCWYLLTELHDVTTRKSITWIQTAANPKSYYDITFISLL